MPFDVFIIGAQKAASSSLHFCLLSHPEIAGMRDESRVFEDPFFSEESVSAEFAKHHKINPNARLTLLKRPNLLCDPVGPERIFDHNPTAKLICIIRNPAERAVSAALHLMKSGLLPVEPIDDVITRICADDLAANSVEWKIREYGFYGKYLAKWIELYGRKRLFLVRQDELHDIDQSYRRVCAFLGIDETLQAPKLNKSKSKSAIRSSARLHCHYIVSRTLRRRISDSGHTEWRRPSGVSRSLAYLFSRTDEAILSKLIGETGEMKPSSKSMAMLRDVYSHDLKRCAELTELDLTVWLP